MMFGRIVWAVLAAWSGSAWSDPGTDRLCAGLERERAGAIARGQWADLERAAHSYAQSCRLARTVPEVSAAMRELAFVSSKGANARSYLDLAMACIKYDYWALACHAEKARALHRLGQTNEAIEAGKTMVGLFDEIERRARFDLYAAQGLKERGRPGWEVLERTAQLRLESVRQARRVGS